MHESKEIKYDINLKRDIKSSYNLNKIFSFLDQRLKLNIIIYNKQIQNIIGVNIQDYKNLSGRHKRGGKNGNGTEYILNTNNMIFNGEYINGKRNGRGNEYNNKKLIFEGEYLNGFRWNGTGYNNNGEIDFIIKNGCGRGKEYNNDGKLEYEGGYFDGKRNGKGKEYHNNGKLKFEGGYFDGKRNGKEKNITMMAN